MKKRMIGLLLATVMVLSCISGLAGCGKSSGVEWSITENDLKNAEQLNISIVRDEADAVTLTATNNKDIFKSDLKNEYFYIVPIIITDDETDEAEGASAQAKSGSDTEKASSLTEKELSQNALKNVAYKWVDGKTLTFSFTDKTEDVVGYVAYIHKNAISTGTYGMGIGADAASVESIVAVSASVAETFTTASVNPTITVKLQNTDTAEGFNKDMITLKNAFADLTITNVSGKGGTIVISTSGKVQVESSLTGVVELAANATAYGKELYASAPVSFVSAYIDEATFEYASGKLIFNICLASDTFLSKDGITMEGMTVTPDSLSEDKKSVTVSVAVAGADVDAAIDALRDKTITVAASSVAGGAEYSLPFSAVRVNFGVLVDFTTKNENSNSFSAEAYLFAKNGTFGALSASDITFGGDFETAADVKVEKISDTEYALKFNFVPAGEVNGENFSFNGIITVAAGKCMNNWGTASKDALYAAASYSSEADRIGIWNILATVKTSYNMVRGFIDANSSVIDTVKNVGSKIGSAVDPVKSVLGFLGIIPTTDSKLDAIQATLNEMQGTLSQIDKEVADIGKQVSSIALAAREQTYENNKQHAQTRWNNHVMQISELKGKIDSFQSNYYTSIKEIVSEKNIKITLYYDDTGVTIPLNMNPNSQLGVNGKRIVSTKEVSLAGLPDSLDMIINNGNNVGKCYEDFLACVKNEVASKLPDGVTAEHFVDELCLIATYRAMANAGGPQNFVNTFIDLCEIICGSKPGVTKPLNEYYTVLSNTYNFASETEAQRYAARLYLSEAVIDGGFIAALASTMLGDKDTEERIDKAFKAANDEIRNNTGDPGDPKGQGKQYCYVANAWIAGSIQDRYYTRPSGEYINDSATCAVIARRYQRLHAAGAVSASNLTDYFKSLGIASFNVPGSVRWVCGVGNTNRKPDYKKWTLKCVSSKLDVDYFGPAFKTGKKYKIGKSSSYYEDDDRLIDMPLWSNPEEITNVDALSGNAFTAYQKVTLLYGAEIGIGTASFCYDDGYPYWLYLLCFNDKK